MENKPQPRFQPGDILRRIPGREIPEATLFRMLRYLHISLAGESIVELEYFDGPYVGQVDNRYEKWMEPDPFLTAVRRVRHAK